MRTLSLLLLLACDPARREALEDLEALEAAIDGYEAWDRHADWPGVGESLDGTHGSHVQMWFDDAFLATAQAGVGDPMPAGAIAVKEGYGDAEGTDLVGVSAHVRQDDGTLFFAMWSPDGDVLEYGRPAACVDCHAMGQDEVMALTW